MSYPPPLPQQPHDPYSGGQYPPQQPQVYQQFYPPVIIAQAPPSSGWAVASLVFGIFGMLGGFCLFGIPCIIAVICGHVGLSETKDGSRSGHGLAIAGLIMGYLFVVPAILFLFLGGLGAVLGSVSPTVTPTP